MKTLVLTLAILVFCGVAYAGYTSNRIGDFDYVTGDNGYSGQGSQIGDHYYYNDNHGNNVTCTTIGSHTYCN